MGRRRFTLLIAISTAEQIHSYLSEDHLNVGRVLQFQYRCAVDRVSDVTRTLTQLRGAVDEVLDVDLHAARRLEGRAEPLELQVALAIPGHSVSDQVPPGGQVR